MGTIDHCTTGASELSDSLRTFGAVLKALRDEARLTQEEFAPKVGYPAAYVAKIEQGKRYPPRELVERSEEVLGPLAARVLGRGAQPHPPGGAGVVVPALGGERGRGHVPLRVRVRCGAGLLQPERCIREICVRRLPPLSDEQADHQVAARLTRQHKCHAQPLWDTALPALSRRATASLLTQMRGAL